MPLLPPVHTIPFPGGPCPSFNCAQKEEAELLMAIFKDHVKFPTLQRGSDGNVIVDFHPRYLLPNPQESDSNSTVFKAIFGHYTSFLQNGNQVWLEDGIGTCFTMKLLWKAMNSVILGTFVQLVTQMTFFLSKLNLRIRKAKPLALSVTSLRFINQNVYCF